LLRNLMSPDAPTLVEDAWRAAWTEMPSIDDRPQRASNVPQPDPSALTVEVASGARLAGLQSDWEDLLARADVANAFMNPALIRLASQFYPRCSCFALLAWLKETSRPRLVGVWAFARGRARQSVILTGSPMPHAYLSDPVIDRTCLDSVLEAMLAHISGDATLPKIVSLETMGTDTATMAALSRVLAARGRPSRIFAAWSRPKLASDLDGASYMGRALSSSSRKKLRQHRRRLADGGLLEFSIISEAEEVRQAFEDFLTLEAAGWKGRRRTALLSRTSDANFARGMIGALAAEGHAYIYALTLDAKPVSMQIVLRAGSTVFTWKTAYDERFRDFSPGMLLLEDCTAAWLTDEGIDHVDSCAFDDSGYMAVWGERAAIARLWLDVRSGRSLVFALLSRLQALKLALRSRAKAIYRRYRPLSCAR
jgi:CelD/BcsL family acetyltransferase involved in cellulose biosynthesis